MHIQVLSVFCVSFHSLLMFVTAHLVFPSYESVQFYIALGYKTGHIYTLAISKHSKQNNIL